jgi:hypothetical protein
MPTGEHLRFHIGRFENGPAISCSTFEKCSTFLHWLTTKESNSENLDHYLDDFFFAGKANLNDCQSLITTFVNILSFCF